MTSRKYSLKRLFSTMLLTSAAMVLVVNTLLASTDQHCKNYTSLDSVPEVFSAQANVSTIDLSRCRKDSHHVTWVSWLFGKPESMQFHYLELLELLNRK
ncbi:hypothetical protein [Agaribacter marinus]|uniref:Uncharacterized protein n=1 Tax=Agaribacter marinus TaxID=1431249 RepID=A0AA37SZZ5_9ALTE|nr:hypothetical protein [Agaribacter marinus]GLR72307.1 hypothetical protein GCM10007852_32150 [Agaribacter marinus]